MDYLDYIHLYIYVCVCVIYSSYKKLSDGDKNKKKNYWK